MTGSGFLYTWSGPDPRRTDVAWVQLGGDHLSAHGSSTTADYTMTYRLVTGPRWVTRRLDVRADGEGWWRALTLLRADSGSWSSQRLEAIGNGDPVETVREHPELGAALDCDLGLCPLTNTMPVRREGLIEASRRGLERHAELTMAWVAVPELEVVPSTQHYASGVPIDGGGAQIRYQSGTFVAHIEVDADGIVVSYPGIGQLVARHATSIAANR